MMNDNTPTDVDPKDAHKLSLSCYIIGFILTIASLIVELFAPYRNDTWCAIPDHLEPQFNAASIVILGVSILTTGLLLDYVLRIGNSK